MNLPKKHLYNLYLALHQAYLSHFHQKSQGFLLSFFIPKWYIISKEGELLRPFKFHPVKSEKQFDGVKKGGLVMAEIIVLKEELFKCHMVRVSERLLADICAEVRKKIGNYRIKKITG